MHMYVYVLRVFGDRITRPQKGTCFIANKQCKSRQINEMEVLIVHIFAVLQAHRKHQRRHIL